jgi:hypothetical protein
MSGFDEVEGGLSMVEQRDLTFRQMEVQARAAIRRGSRRVMVNPSDLLGALATLEALQEHRCRQGRPERRAAGGVVDGAAVAPSEGAGT